MILTAAQNASPSQGPDPDLVTPGTIGFLSTLVIVIVVIFLIRDALKRVRRVRARAQADDAYPIPMRKHAVPNQSKLSGETAPDADEETGTAAAETTAEVEETGAAAESSESEQSDPESIDPEQSDSVSNDSEQSDPARSQD